MSIDLLRRKVCSRVTQVFPQVSLQQMICWRSWALPIRLALYVRLAALALSVAERVQKCLVQGLKVGQWQSHHLAAKRLESHQIRLTK